MLEREEVLRHRAEVVGAEYAHYSGVIADMKSAAARMLEVARTVERFEEHAAHAADGPDIPTSEDHPRISLTLLQAAYRDSSRPHLRKQAQAFATEFAQPLLGIPEPAPSLEGVLSGETIGCCSAAELHFADAHTQLQQGTATHARLSVYHLADGTPIALRKKVDVSSALLLEGVRLPGDQTLYPGTIVAIGNAGVRQSGEYTHPAGWLLTSYEVGDGVQVQPARLSSWAYPDTLDRSLFATNKLNTFTRNCVGYDETRADYVASYTLGDFRDVAYQALQLTSVLDVGDNMPQTDRSL